MRCLVIISVRLLRQLLPAEPCKLLLLPLVVGISYEINRWVGRHNNAFTKVLTAPGLWMQNFTTNEPDEDMIRTGIAALEAVLPENEGEDRW